MRMMILTLSLAAFQVACSDDKKEAQKDAAIQACLSDPTGMCQYRAATYAGLPASLPASYPAPAALNTYKGLTNPASWPLLATNAQIQSQAAKVVAAMKAQSLDPDSPFYEPHTKSNPLRAPSSVAAVKDAPAPAAAGASGAGVAGDISR